MTVRLYCVCCCSEYKSPEYEALACDMVVRRLMDVGYPKVSFYCSTAIVMYLTGLVYTGYRVHRI